MPDTRLFFRLQGVTTRQSVPKYTDFWRESAKICIPLVHSVRWHSTTDGRIATWMHALTPPMISLRLIKIWWTFVYGNSWVLRARLRRGTVRWALPRISSYHCTLALSRVFRAGVSYSTFSIFKFKTEFNFLLQLLKVLWTLLSTTLRKLSTAICVTVRIVHCTTIQSLIKKYAWIGV